MPAGLSPNAARISNPERIANIALSPNSSIIFRPPNTARHGGLSPYSPAAYFVR